MSFKNISLFSQCALFCISGSLANAMPQVTIQTQAGRRAGDNLASTIFYLPYTSNGYQTIGLDIRGLYNNCGDTEVNLGLDYGTKIGDNAALKIFTHYDRRRISDAQSDTNYLHGMTIGKETYYKSLLFKTTAFLPFTTDQVLTNCESQFNSRYGAGPLLQAKPGMEVEAGVNHRINHTTKFQLLGGIYKYFDELTGLRLRANLTRTIKDLDLHIGVKIEYDKPNGFRPMLSIGLSNHVKCDDPMMENLISAPYRDPDIRAFHSPLNQNLRSEKVEQHNMHEHEISQEGDSGAGKQSKQRDLFPSIARKIETSQNSNISNGDDSSNPVESKAANSHEVSNIDQNNTAIVGSSDQLFVASSSFAATTSIPTAATTPLASEKNSEHIESSVISVISTETRVPAKDNTPRPDHYYNIQTPAQPEIMPRKAESAYSDVSELTPARNIGPTSSQAHPLAIHIAQHQEVLPIVEKLQISLAQQPSSPVFSPVNDLSSTGSSVVSAAPAVHNRWHAESSTKAPSQVSSAAPEAGITDIQNNNIDPLQVGPTRRRPSLPPIPTAAHSRVPASYTRLPTTAIVQNDHPRRQSILTDTSMNRGIGPAVAMSSNSDWIALDDAISK